MVKYLTLTVFGFLCLYSCKKECDASNPAVSDVQTDTIYPNQYFPAYPGSWWEYTDSSVITIDDNWFNHLVELEGEEDKHGCQTIIEQHNFVPKTDDDFVVYGGTIKKLVYQTIGSEWGYQDTGYEIILFPTTSDGVLFSEGYGRSWRAYYESVDSVITPAGTFYNVLGFTEHKEAYGSDHTWHDVSWDTIYYAKDVGIVKQITTKWYINTPSETRLLNSYFINN
ncbi:hypothetical protein K6119_00595 [Paracrocinitomix mangrovi]|uniref:hypothetical protein n=1 Tax=Paracrocinitomix mangrovi TaxID=2862509 RepID=UPI001C8E3E50|nr:hypothetical protein [Paracrocinitomix mangrovi]UKN02013.1 hypothetical protein K6119_00595 [Paracrocinitomix mangrovi]